MVVLNISEVVEQAPRKAMSLQKEQQEEGITKKGFKFFKRKLTLNDGSLIVYVVRTKSFGLKEFKEDSRFSFSLILREEDKNSFEVLEERIRKKAEKFFPDASFDKFSTMRENTLFCRVPFNAKKNLFYTAFTDKAGPVSHNHFDGRDCEVDAAFQIKGVFVTKGRAFLEVDLLEVRKRRDCTIRSYPPPLMPDFVEGGFEEFPKNYDSPIEEDDDESAEDSESESEGETLGESIQKEYKKQLKESPE